MPSDRGQRFDQGRGIEAEPDLGRNPAMIIGDLIVLLLTVVPVALTVLALRVDPHQLVDLFGPAVR
jgi:hypothetical protein